MISGILVGYFNQRKDAVQAVKRLRSKGHRRVAWVSRSPDGEGYVSDPYLRRKLTLTIGTFLLSFSLSIFILRNALHPSSTFYNLPYLFIPPVLFGFILVMIVALAIRRSHLGVEKKTIQQYARLLAVGETALILQTSIDKLHLCSAIVLEVGEIPPAVFVLHPTRENKLEEYADQHFGETALNPLQFVEFAHHLAMAHSLDDKPVRDAGLLKRLERNRWLTQQICLDLSEATQLQLSVPPTAEWLLDNEYILESNTRDVRLNVKWSYYRQLPALASNADHGLPRVYGLARELAVHTELFLEKENILSFIEAYQSVKPLSIGELWAIPQMLRIVLIEAIGQIAIKAQVELREQEAADLWANRLISMSRRDPNQLYSVMAKLTESYPDPSPTFASGLMDYLYDEATALEPVKSWLERAFRISRIDLISLVRNRQTKDQIAVGNAISSLRRLSLLDWNECFEQLSQVDRILRHDPAGVYHRMNFTTRDRYRRVVEVLGKRSGLDEETVASKVIELAQGIPTELGHVDPPEHIGTCLIGEKRAKLAQLLECRESAGFRFRKWAQRHHTAVYLLGIALITVILAGIILFTGLSDESAWKLLVVAVLLVIPVSQLSIELINTLIVRIFPPTTLPKMDFKISGIPDSCLTLVVVPMMLSNADTVSREAEKLEIRFLANKQDNLFFALYSDYLDADTAGTGADGPLLQAAIQSISDLNRKYGGDRFFLFHRERKWCESEQKFIGWERKRGKLEELNDLIVGTRHRDAPPLVHVGDPERLTNIKYVITLDSDTQLPSGAARRLIETMAHPLNVAQADARGRIVSGYTIIQPRVSPSLPSTSGTIFSRLFSDPVGIDPYTNTVSDVYQDLTGEGSYHGKGIYDVHAFSRVLSGRFPESSLLSHDLIEGAHVRVGLASDIELYDEFPQDYLSYAKRQHRWTRGDWQIAAWTKPKVPQAAGGSGENPLPWFGRWKVFDNLRRSLLPVASIGLLMTGFLISPRAGAVISLVVAIQLFFQSLVQPFSWVTKRHGMKDVTLSKIVHDLLRIVVEAALLPYQAWVSMDAIARVCYRRMVSHRHLLEWTSAQAVHDKSQSKVPMFVLSMSLASLFSVLSFMAVGSVKPANLLLASPWLALWFLSPLMGWLLNLRSPVIDLQSLLPESDRQFLRIMARRTWRFFADFVTAETHFLPPDNYQESYQNGVAMRTSPTNIGLYLVSVLGAQELGYVTVDELEQRLDNTLGTIQNLERYEGHLLNWYDIGNLAPLMPRYVSSVDSGNLMGAIWTLNQGISALCDAPLLDTRAFEGLLDTGKVLRRAVRDSKQSGFDTHNLQDIRLMDLLMRDWTDPDLSAIGLIRKLRLTKPKTDAIADKLAIASGPQNQVVYWSEQLRRQMDAWTSLADRYLVWVEILAEKTEEEVANLNPQARGPYLLAVRQAPSLRDLAGGKSGIIPILLAARLSMSKGNLAILSWIDRVTEAFSRARWLAGEALGWMDRISGTCTELSASINMRFLYNQERRLFSIGFSVTEGRLDRSYYDLLASESRLGSFVAIADGSVPIEHWFSLNRPYGAIGRRRVLLSWTGTMFEYLMPLLFQTSYGSTLMDKATREVVDIQMDFGRKHKVPWGISESAYADIDLHKTYQYKAFGVPELGLKRGLTDKIVVAPYATMLAVGIRPRESVQNLKRLAALGMLGDYGYYEAIDYSRTSGQEITPGIIVHAYMAHHQGMGFLALTNLLRDNCLRHYFHSDPRVRAVEPLLLERIPHQPPLHHISTREKVVAEGGLPEAVPLVSQCENPNVMTPVTQLLSNGPYSLMLTSAGGGYSRWNNFDITRWRTDSTQDSWGTYLYLHDLDSGSLWCNTYQPIAGKAEHFCANFSLDRAVYQRVDHDIDSETEIVVTPEDDVEIRRLTLINRSIRTRHIALTSYIELAMAPHNADRQHPVFNKMFIQTEALPEHNALLAYRRPRSDGEYPIFVAHRITMNQNPDREKKQEMQFETERGRFIGRGHTLANPIGATLSSGNNQGFVMDPILSLRQVVTLAPGQRIQVSMVLAAATSREAVLGQMSKYGDPHALDRAIDFAWASAQLELRLLRIHPDEARRFQQLASHLLYPNPLLRTTAQQITDNRKGQSGLWAYGISGDLPIVLAAIGESHDLGMIRQLLQAHSYWRLHGLVVDLVILNEESGGYTQPLRDELEQLINTYGTGTGRDQPGGIFLRSNSLIPSEDLTLLRAAASVVLVAARGALPQQLATQLSDQLALTENLIRKKEIRDPSIPLPFMELPYFNGLGGFTKDGREYVIYLGPDTHTPAPWANVIANPSFGTLVSETGAGFTWQGNSQRNRLTQWSNDPVLDTSSEAIYLRDEDTGSYWTPTASPVREKDAYRTRHGAGYSVFEHNSHGIQLEMTVFVPVDDQGGEAVKLQKLALRNETDRPRRLTLTYYVEWTMGEARETSQMHIVTAWDEDAQAMLARNNYHPDYADRVAFAAVSGTAVSYTGDRTSFIGRNRTLSAPMSMEQTRLSRKTGAGLDPCSVIQVAVKLAPGGVAEIICMLGQSPTVEQAHQLVSTYRDSQMFENRLRQTQAWWDDRLGTIQVVTPELPADFLVNRWLLYQTLGCRLWARSGFYQSGGAYGFRDQLQDVMALLYARPGLAREHILVAAARQFKEGDVQHWWHPPGGSGIRSQISDDLLWLPFVVAQYLRVTQDVGILHETVPFLEAPVLNADQHESFQVPGISFERASIFEHCRRALERSQKFGIHGLPLMGSGDWNDGMNLVGSQGKGESVWLGWFMADVMQGMAEMAELYGQAESAVSFLESRTTLVQHIENFAWDGKWYLRATYDDGSLLGSATSMEAKIDSLPQSWALLSGAAEPVRAAQALESAWEHLVHEQDGLVQLFTPPFDKSDPTPGYIKGYPPGVRENGGQYTHAAIWLAMAMARCGDGTRAEKILRIINPIEHSREPESAWRYKIEPYVVAADIYSMPGRVGQGGWSWYTGSAAWMYRAWIEDVLGLKVRGETLRLDPVIPGRWDQFQIKYRHGEAQYEISVINPGHVEHGVEWVEMDGRHIEDGVIQLERELVRHKIVVRMG